MGAVHVSETMTTDGTERDDDAQQQGDVADLPALRATYGRGKVHWRVIALKRAARPPRGFMAPR